MKKILAMAVLILSLIVLQIPQAAASDNYVGTWEGGWKAYLMDETVKFGKNGNEAAASCRLKGVSSNGTTKYFDYVFTFYQNGRISFRDSSGASGSFVLGSPGVYQVEHETAIHLMAIMKAIMDSRR